MVGIFDPACELLPHGRRNYTCVLLPLYLLSDLPPPPRKLSVSQWGWGGGGVVSYVCRPYSAGVLDSVSDQIRNLQNFFTTPNKITSKDDI